MSERFRVVVAASPDDIERAASSVADAPPIGPGAVIDLLDAWGRALSGVDRADIPGAAFLELWLRRGTLEPIVERELGSAGNAAWSGCGDARTMTHSVGLVGHWPAANVTIQPLLSLSCALLGGNRSLVRIPPDLVEPTERLLAPLADTEAGAALSQRVVFVSFPSDETALHEAMARRVDGALVWGGRESVLAVRALPFPHWARIVVFGPRVSAAVFDRGAWTDPDRRSTWCRWLARDVWQFEQQACSSPHALFVERADGHDVRALAEDVAKALAQEDEAHPRTVPSPALASAIARSRADWVLDSDSRDAIYPATPDWTVLVGDGPEMPDPVGGRVLFVLAVDDIAAAVSRFDGNVQTLGLACEDRETEAGIADAAARHGVDRIVKVGRMHVFGSPWDGMPLITPMVRKVVHSWASEGEGS